MKILHVAETAKGGVGSFLDELIPLQCIQLGSENILAIVPAEHRSQLSSVSDKNLSVFPRSSRSLRAIYELRRQIVVTIREFRPDILHLQSTFAGVIGRTGWSRIAQCPIIYNPHGWAFEMWPSGPKRMAAAAVERLLARRCDRIVAVSEAERGQAIAVGLPSEKLTVVRNGIATAQPQVDRARWMDDRTKVLFLGRLDRQKGYDTLVGIAARNTERIAVRVVGAAVASMPTAARSPANVDHLGWLDRGEITRHLKACDVVAMPSRWEAFGLVAIEAMRASKPVIAFAVGGLPEVIEDRVTGHLIPAGDAAEFERMLLSKSPSEWRAFGPASQRRFQDRFTSQRMADELLKIYASI
jgi:glycosyltransferase involved in cell wall biosynthesis